MSDTPTRQANKETTTVPPIPARMKSKHEQSGYGGSIKATTPGIKVVPTPAAAKKSTTADDGRRESNAGARRPWKSRGIPTVSKGTSDVKPAKVSQKVGDASNGISTKTGYKKL